jgi:hypothetical protein
MKVMEFTRLPVYECMTESMGLEIGSKFLTGIHMVSQKENKEIGQSITYYEVIDINGDGTVCYTPRYEMLEGNV